MAFRVLNFSWWIWFCKILVSLGSLRSISTLIIWTNEKHRDLHGLQILVCPWKAWKSPVHHSYSTYLNWQLPTELVSVTHFYSCFFFNGRVIFILSTPFRPQWFGPTSPSRREVKVQKLEFGPAARAAKILPEAMAKVSPETMVYIGDLHLFETIYGVFNNYVWSWALHYRISFFFKHEVQKLAKSRSKLPIMELLSTKNWWYNLSLASKCGVTYPLWPLPVELLESPDYMHVFHCFSSFMYK